MLRKKLNQERATNVSRANEIIAASEARAAAGGDDIGFTADELTELAALTARREVIEANLAALNSARDAGETTPQREMAGNVTQIHDRAGDKPWKSFGEQLQAIASAMTPGGSYDPRLGDRAAASGANQTNPSEGGFLVEMDYSEALLDRAREESQLLQYVFEIPLAEGTDGIELPYIDETSRATGSRWGGVQVYRKAEAATVTAAMPKIAEIEIRAAELMGIAYTTDRLIRNAPALEAIFQNAFASEFAFQIDNEIIRGTGAGQCLGILNALATVSQAKESGQSAATIVTKNLSNMWAHLPVRSMARAVWFINSECNPALDELSIPAGTAALEPRFVRYNEQGTLTVKGRPVVPLEQCEALGTVGDIILADLSQYAVVTQGGIDSQQSMHVRFLYGENTFRWTWVINGQPTWRTSKTPFKGSTTISPLVTLASRA